MSHKMATSDQNAEIENASVRNLREFMIAAQTSKHHSPDDVGKYGDDNEDDAAMDRLINEITENIFKDLKSGSADKQVGQNSLGKKCRPQKANANTPSVKTLKGCRPKAFRGGQSKQKVNRHQQTLQKSTGNLTNLNDQIDQEIRKLLSSQILKADTIPHHIKVCSTHVVSKETLENILSQTLQYKIKVNDYNAVNGSVVAKLEFHSGKTTQAALKKLQTLQSIGMHFSSDDGDDMTKYINDAISDFKSKPEIPLLVHEDKIKGYILEINDIITRPNLRQDDLERIDALESKVQELGDQKKEFINFLESMEKEYKNLKLSNYRKETKRLRLQFGLEILRFKNALPMYAKRSAIIKCVSENQVSVILGETGSGKSTQMVQYLINSEELRNGNIVCTQPRKVAAISLAQHVAREMGGNVGQLVGFKVGAHSKQSASTRIHYVTDHTLLNECIADPLLKKYTCIIIDEAHERSIFTDLLLGMIKKALPQRPELRVVVTSATIDPEVFIKYFNGCPVLKVSGRCFPVEVFYERSKQDITDVPKDYVKTAVEKSLWIHKNLTKGDILVFLTSPAETEAASALCQKGFRQEELLCMSLHGQQQPDDQRKVFDAPNAGQRKVVFATNCAETSITITGIKYVIDTGLSKEKQFDPRKNMSTLTVRYVSRSSADQRKGRAGRTAPGVCYRLYDQDIYEEMNAISVPEILRSHLGQSLLKLMVIGIANPIQFDFVQSPSMETLLEAEESLKELGAIDDQGKITKLGVDLSKLSLEPRLGKIVLEGIEQGIGMYVVILAGVGAVGYNVFYRGKSDEEKETSDKLKLKLSESRGDIFTAVKVYIEWDAIPEKKKASWCSENSLNSKSLRIARDNMTEILRILDKEVGIKVKYEHLDLVKADDVLPQILATCYGQNLCFYVGHRRLGYVPVTDPTKLYPIHPSSILSNLRNEPKWLIYEQILNTSREFLINVTYLTDEETSNELSRRGLSIGFDTIENMQVEEVLVPKLGPSVTRQLVFKSFGSPRKLEGHLQNVLEDTRIAVDLSDNEVRVSARKNCLPNAVNIILTKAEVFRAPLRRARHEHEIIEQSRIRLLVEAGGMIRTVLMPEHNRKLIIKNVPIDITEDDVHAKLAEYGEIESLIRYPPNGRQKFTCWGKIVFTEHAAAKSAFDELTQEEGYKLAEDSPRNNQAPKEARVKVTCLRRPLKGFGYAVFDDDVDASLAIANSYFIQVNGQSVHISLNKKNANELCLKNLPSNASTKEVKQAFADVACYPTDLRLIREKAYATSIHDIEMFKRQIRRQIDQQIQTSEHYDINLFKPKKDQDFTLNGFINFGKTDDAVAAVRTTIVIIDNGKTLPVFIEPQLDMTEFIQRDVYGILRNEIQDLLKELHRPGNSLNYETLNNGCFRIRLTVSNLAEWDRCRTLIDEVVSADEFEIEDEERKILLSSMRGRRLLKDVMKKEHVFVNYDRFRSILLIYGSADNKKRAHGEILRYFDDSNGYSIREVHLTGPSKPAGILRELFKRYQIDLEQFTEETGISDISVRVRDHILVLRGNDESFGKADGILSEIIAKLGEGSLADQADELTCPVCFCPPDEKSYKTEYCGHTYCLSCIQGLVHHVVSAKEFPITCVGDACGEPLVMIDLYNLIGDSWDALRELANSALEHFVLTNKFKFSYCITSGCPVVFKVTSNKGLFRCPNEACQAEICTACKKKYHEDLSCAMFKGMQNDADYSLKAWIKQSPEKRAICPKCGIGIEKNGGCNRVSCKCGANICWVCKEIFSTAQETYDHLARNCGGIFGNDAY